HVQEMHVRAVDLGGELGKPIQLPLGRTPVVGGAPVAGEVFEVAQGYPALPADAGQLGRPAGVVEPAVQVVQGGLRDVDTERLHRLLLIMSASVKRWQKSPAVAGSGTRSAPSAFMYAT